MAGSCSAPVDTSGVEGWRVVGGCGADFTAKNESEKKARLDAA